MIAESDITFAGSRIDRADHLRADGEGLLALLLRPDARAALFWRGKPLFDLTPEPRLVWAPGDDALVGEALEAPLFLGLEDGAPRFAADLSHLDGPEDETGAFVDRTTFDLSETRKFIDLRSIMGELSGEDAAHAATAKAIFEWHLAHGFCARCGGPSAPASGGWRRDCPNCEAMHFPRTDPVVIMLITHGDRVLMGRSPNWPEGMYSLLAGFMEPGETIEAAVRREVGEEAGVPVGAVGYLASQPWPFPASLMIGCIGEALDDSITLDQKELEHAFWAGREEIVASLEGRHPTLSAARRGAIARSLLEGWIRETA